MHLSVSWATCAPFGASLVGPEGAAGLYIAAVIITTALGFGNTFGAAEQVTLIAGTGFNTALFAFGGCVWGIAGGGAGVATELIVAVLGAFGISCSRRTMMLIDSLVELLNLID